MALKTSLKIHEFTLVLANVDTLMPDLADALYAIVDDATAGSCNGEVTIDFHRKAPSFQQAVRSAVDDIRKASLEVARVETEEYRLLEQINSSLS